MHWIARAALLVVSSGLVAAGAVAGLVLVFVGNPEFLGVASARAGVAVDVGVVWFVCVGSVIGAGAVWWLGVSVPGSSAGVGTGAGRTGRVIESAEAQALVRELETACVKVLDEHCMVQEMNRACLEFMEAESEEPFIGTYAPAMLRPSDRPGYVEAIRRAAAGETSEIEFELVGLNGARRWLFQRARRLGEPAQGEAALVLCVTREITQSKLVKDRLDLAIEITRQGLWDEWVQTGEVYYNDSWYTMLGYEPGELPMSVQTWHELLHPDDLYVAREAFSGHIEGEAELYSTQYRLRTKDGSWKWVHDIGKIVERAENGVPLRAIGVHIDIDVSKRLELALRSVVSFRSVGAEESVLQHLCRTMTEAFNVDMVCVSRLDEEGLQRASVVAGWGAQGAVPAMTYELAGTPCEVTAAKEYCHFEDGVRDRYPADAFLVESGAASYTGTLLRSSSGEVLGLLTIVDRNRRPGSEELESTVRLFGSRAASELERSQIESELHRTRERLLSYADRLETATSGAGLGVFEVRFDTGEMIWDETMHELFGTAGREVTPSVELWEARLHPEDRERVRRLEGQVRRGLNRIEASFRVLPGGETVRHLRVAATVRRSAGGDALSVTGVCWDISDVARANQRLLEAKELAERASRAKSEFLANMSHEIRTPLTAIVGYTDLLACDERFAGDPVKLAMSLRAIQSNADHLLVILNDILDLSKIDAGQMHVESIEVRPADLIRDAVGMLAARAQAKGIGLGVVYGTELPCLVRSDPTRVRQILLNLVGNAIKFTEKGGVSVEVGYQPLPDRTGALTIAVRDTGIGIAEGDLRLLRGFNPFTQADGSTTRRFGGTGLGLSLTNQFAQKLGGDLRIESEPGKGSVFTVTVRVEPVIGGTMHRPEPVQAARGARQSVLRTEGLAERHILLVEDGPDNQRLISYMLMRAGARVTLACNGKEAVEVVRRLRGTADGAFDLVLMDMQMPEIDGYSATGLLRGLGYEGPIVALTAHAMEGDRQRCLDAGCQDYLTKPISSQDLVDTSVRWMGWRLGASPSAAAA